MSTFNPVFNNVFNPVFSSVEGNSGWSVDFTLGALTGGLSFTRASNGRYFNSSGINVNAATDTPRFEYNPLNTSRRGLLVEESKTNLLLQSRTFNTTWTQVSIASLTGGQSSLFGDNGAWLVSNTLTSSRLEQTITVVTGNNVIGILTKQASGGALSIRIDNGANVFQYTLNYTTKTLTKSGVADAVNFGVIDLGNGWLYPWYSYNSTATTSVVRVYPNVSTPLQSCYIDNIQHELGNFPTSQIVTTASAATRAYDSVRMLDLTVLGVNLSEFTMVAEWEYSGVLANTGYVLSLSDGTFNNYIALRPNSGSTLHGGVVVTGAATVAALYDTLGVAGVQKQAFAVKGNDFAYCINGGTVQTDTSGIVPTLNSLYVGSGPTGANAFLNGWIRKITFYNERLSNSQLQILTA